MKDKNGKVLTENDTVDCYPDQDSLAQHEFRGTIVKFRLSGGDMLAVVRDQDDARYEFESHELERVED